MRRLILLITILSLLGVTAAQSQRRTTFEQITVANTAIGVTAAIRDGMSACGFRLETAQVRWRIDAAPTASVGTLLEVGDTMTVERAEDLNTLKFIRTGSTSGLINCWCWTQ
jgi:hypothetical protein